MRLLDLCGVRFLKAVTIDGNEIEVTCPLEADAEGIVRFNYSIFEKMKRNESSYDLNTCEVTVSDCGMDELGMAIMLLMILQESYSETPCYLSLRNEILRINGRTQIIEYILGLQPRFRHRADTRINK